MKVTTKKTPETEKQIQSYLLRRLVAAGWVAIRQNSGMAWLPGKDGRKQPVFNYQIANTGKSAGICDVWAAKDNRVLLVEVKDAKGKTQPSQEEFARLAASCGVTCHLVHSIADVDNLLAEVSA